MAKDPAFLFYSSDFLTGTFFMNDEQTGKYIKLLCLQHQMGGLSEKEIIIGCGGKMDEMIFAKFDKHNDGLYYNYRLHKEAKKRSDYCNSRRHNLDKTSPEKKPVRKPYVSRMENEDEDINKDKKEIENIIDYMNKVLETNYKYSTNGTVKHIKARLKEGFIMDDFYLVIEKKARQWKDDPKMAQYLRPQTLFTGKFEGYLNQITPKEKTNFQKNVERTLLWMNETKKDS